ncbi:hypothetical protein V6N13_106129 [Hibiscus sabdariffa]|uniref:Uncharacterized protein n=1 Tax=Hibiscus sabdariffa TaxID=183260 RepID=A0ABR2EZT1_9ROSI
MTGGRVFPQHLFPPIDNRNVTYAEWSMADSHGPRLVWSGYETKAEKGGCLMSPLPLDACLSALMGIGIKLDSGVLCSVGILTF